MFQISNYNPPMGTETLTFLDYFIVGLATEYCDFLISFCARLFMTQRYDRTFLTLLSCAWFLIFTSSFSYNFFLVFYPSIARYSWAYHNYPLSWLTGDLLLVNIYTGYQYWNQPIVQYLLKVQEIHYVTARRFIYYLMYLCFLHAFSTPVTFLSPLFA